MPSFSPMAAIDRLMQRVLVAVEIFHEGLEPAFVVQIDRFRLDAAGVGQHEMHAGIQERQLAQAMLQGGVVELGLGEGFFRRKKRDFGPGEELAVLLRRLGDHGQRRLGNAMAEAHVVLLAVAPDAQIQPLRQRIDHGDADAVEAAGHLVGILVELTAGMELGHDDLGRRHAFFLVDVDGDAAAVVAHGDRAVAVERDVDQVAIAGQGFVDGVVHHLIDHVMQAGAVVGVADIHARPLAHGIEPAQDLDRFGVVLSFRRIAVGRFGVVCHLFNCFDPWRRRKAGAD